MMHEATVEQKRQLTDHERTVDVGSRPSNLRSVRLLVFCDSFLYVCSAHLYE